MLTYFPSSAVREKARCSYCCCSQVGALRKSRNFLKEPFPTVHPLLTQDLRREHFREFCVARLPDRALLDLCTRSGKQIDYVAYILENQRKKTYFCQMQIFTGVKPLNF